MPFFNECEGWQGWIHPQTRICFISFNCFVFAHETHLLHGNECDFLVSIPTAASATWRFTQFMVSPTVPASHNLEVDDLDARQDPLVPSWNLQRVRWTVHGLADAG
jgi:hypothetical protein